jgi:hypothetical protein
MKTMCLWFLTLMIPFASYAAGQRWYNPNVSDDVAQSRFNIDQGECLARAYQAVQVPSYLPQQQSSNTTEFSGYSQGGGAFSGQMRTNPSSGTLMERLQQHNSNVQAQQQVQAAQDAQRSVAIGCMSSRGWELR